VLISILKIYKQELNSKIISFFLLILTFTNTIMETIKIEFQPNVKEKLIEFLNSFKYNEVHIIEEESNVIRDEAYWQYRNRLHLEVDKIKSGESKLYDFDELDAFLEETIAKYES
jgi:hypothetical protein